MVLSIVFTHVANSHADLLEQKKVFTQKRVRPSQDWDTNMAAVLLFWDTNMAALTPCENTLLMCQTLSPRSQYRPTVLPQLQTAR